MKEEGYNIIFCRNPSHGRVSVRHNIEGLDMGGMLKKHGIGGGHFCSAGFWVTDINDFKVKINMLENEISADFPK
jgi:hypothetical protein